MKGEGVSRRAHGSKLHKRLTRKSDSVGNALDEGSGTSEGRRRHVLATRVPKDDRDRDVERHREGLADEHGLGVVARVLHLGLRGGADG